MDQVCGSTPEQFVSFKEMARQKKLNENTIRRAYRYGRRTAGKVTPGGGQRAPVGRYSHVGHEKIQQIRRSLSDGQAVSVIAKAVGVSDNTVYRERHRLRKER